MVPKNFSQLFITLMILQRRCLGQDEPFKVEVKNDDLIRPETSTAASTLMLSRGTTTHWIESDTTLKHRSTFEPIIKVKDIFFLTKSQDSERQLTEVCELLPHHN